MAEKNSLWKNIRNKAKKNRETGAKPKQPTTEMLRQERKIKAKKADGGPVKENPLYKSNEDYVYNQWRESMPENLREESTGYNLRGAWEGGLEPEYVTDDMSFHLGSRNPNTGEILKSPEHHTYDMAIEGDIRAGYTPRVDVRTGTMYSTNSNDPTTAGPFKGYAKGGKYGEDGGLEKKLADLRKQAAKPASKVPTAQENFINTTKGIPNYSMDPNYQASSVGTNYTTKEEMVNRPYPASGKLDIDPGAELLPLAVFEAMRIPGLVKNYKYNMNHYKNAPVIGNINLAHPRDLMRARKALNKATGIAVAETVPELINAEGGYYPTQGPPKALFKGYANGGYTNPYNQYQDDPYLNYADGGYMYGKGGRTWKNIGAGAFGVLEGVVDTTFGWIPGVDYATDMAYKGLQKVGGSSADEIREQDSIHGYGQTAGAIGSAILTSGATTGAAISEGAEGLGQGIGKGNESEKWARDVNTGLNIAGKVVGTAYSASEGAKAAQEGFKLSQAGSQGIGKFAAAAPVRGFSAAPKGTMQGVIDGSAVSMKPGTDAALSSITPTTSVGTFNTSNIPNVNTSSTFNKVADVTSSLSALPKSQEQPPMAEPVSVPAPPPLPPQTDYNQFAVNPPTINTGFETPEYDFNYNPSLPTFSQGGNITNNSLNLRNTMRYKRFAKGGTFDQFGINFIPESAGLHHESANGGVPIGPNALAEGGEAKLQMADGSQYIVSGEVDGANTQSINGETMTQRLKKKLKPFMMGGLASNPKDKENVRRPFDSYSEPAITQAANAAVQETEAIKMQRGGALQYAANGGKLNKDIEKIVMEEYTAAYGGVLPNKYKGKVNMPNSYAKGGIHIKESKKGTFTAAATKHGKSVQEFAQQVLANKENYSPAMVKKANFARNASKWNHADGGYVYNPMTQPMLAEGGPIYGDPASEYVYAQGGMYGDPYYRGGQIDYTNDMYSSYASGGPMVGNAPQAFKGPAAQNRGGMLMNYANGGMMPQEQQMQQQGGQDQMMQMVQQIAQAIMQGANPEQLMAELEGSGMPPEQIQQVMQAAMQMAAQQQQQQPMQGQQQMMPQQGMMSSGGKLPKDILRARAESHMSPKEASNYVNNYSRGGTTSYDGGGRFGLSEYSANPNSVMEQLLAPVEPYKESYWDDDTDYNRPVIGEATTPNGLGMNFKSAPQMANQVTQLGKLAANNTGNISQTVDTPWYEEPLYSKASRYSQAIPGVVASITAMRNKKRRLDPELMAAQTVNYEPERIIDREESRRALDSGLRQMRNSASNTGMLMGNTRDAILNANKGLAGRIAESVMREANTNAQLAQQAGMTNVANKNQFKQLNEQMFQNAQTQAIAGLQDTTGKLASTAAEERKQYLQEWIAKNRLGTRSYKTNINGQDVFVNADGQIYDAKTGTLLSAG